MMLLLVCVVLLGTTIVKSQILENNNQIQEEPSYRLTGEAIPLTYEIILEPDFETFTFKGFVYIETSIIKRTNSVLIHENNIKTSTITAERNGTKLVLNGIERDKERNFLKISVEEDLLIGDTVDIFINYEGNLNKYKQGVYRIKYENANGTESWAAVTHMEPTYARQVFPCFDEPALKANFTLNIIRQTKYNSASNTKLIKTTQLDPDRYMDTFETTMKMSTYLFAFFVSEFAQIESDGHIVYGRAEAISDGYGNYPLENSKIVMALMEEITNVSYSLDKIGQVAVPSEDFYISAMEDWGLVMYQESLLLYKENVSSIEQRDVCLEIMGHEYSHQWFGDLVSPMWWEYLWLNEGFATYYAYYIPNIIEPSSRKLEQFVPDVHQYALDYDSTENTRPMSKYVEQTNDILDLFDEISYDKAASVFRMCEHYLSTSVFNNGLNKYLNKMAYSSATPTDLFNGLQESVDELRPEWIGSLNIHDIFNTWHTQSGYPLINAIRDYDQNTLQLTQNRFHSSKNASSTYEIYDVPINYASATNPDFNETTPTFWLLKRSDSLQLENENSWIIINKKSTGYYRVNYDKTNWLKIALQLMDDHTVIDPLNRAQLIDDSFSLAEAGVIDYNIPLTLTEYITNEIDFIPLRSFYKHTSKLNKILANSEISEKFKAHVRSLLTLAYEAHSFDITEHSMILNRGQINTIMCQLEHEKCTSKMEDALIKSLTTGQKIHPDLQSSVYCGGMINNNNLEMKWEKLYQRYNEVELGEKTRIIQGLSYSSDKTILNRVLLTAAGMYKHHKFDGHNIKNAFKSVSSGSYLGVVTTLEFFIENYQTISLPQKEKSIILNNISKGLFTQEHKQTFEKLISYESDAKVANAIKNAVSNIDQNIQIIKLAVPQISTYLNR